MSPLDNLLTEDFTGFPQSNLAWYRGQIVLPDPSGKPIAIKPRRFKFETQRCIVRGDTLKRFDNRPFQQ